MANSQRNALIKFKVGPKWNPKCKTTNFGKKPRVNSLWVFGPMRKCPRSLGKGRLVRPGLQLIQ
jgi:hypothetical protein